MPDVVAVTRWWRQPVRFRVGLAVILVVFLALTCWNLSRGGDFSFYEASARSMSESWRALLFGAFDPSATVTLDKLSGFAIPQAGSIALFGMSTSAVALPQVLEGLVTVWACSLIGLRWAGPGAGLVAAAGAATTPIFVSMFAHPMEDGLLTMSLAVALLLWQRAMLSSRVWPLVVAALFVGIGFQAKMAQAWFILPALALGTIVWAVGPVRRRLGRAAVLVGGSVAASLAWITAMQLVPASSRPYVDGSTDDSVFAMVFGYNGVDRLLPGAVPGAVGSPSHAASGSSPLSSIAHLVSSMTAADPTGGSGGGAGGGETSWKLLGAMYATQVGWLYPLAVVGIGCGALLWWRARRRRRGGVAGAGGAAGAAERSSTALLVVLTVWLVTAAAVLSVARIPHTAYVAAIGVQLALLAALGWVGAVALLRSRSTVRWVFGLALLAATPVWGAVLAAEGGMPPVLAWSFAAVATAGLVTAAAAGRLVARRPGVSTSGPGGASDASGASGADADGATGASTGASGTATEASGMAARATATSTTTARRRPRPRTPGRRAAVVLSLAAAVTVLAGPALYSAQVIDSSRDGSGGDAYVGIKPTQPTASHAFTPSVPAPWGGSVELSSQESALVSAASDAGGGRDGHPLLLTDSWALSADIISATGDSVLTDGGYSGSVQVFSADAVRQLIESGRTPVVAVKGGASTTDPVREAVSQDHCTSVGTFATGQGRTAKGQPEDADPKDTTTLYRCD